ncbi:hypothetical protein Q0Y04_15090 [Clostridioides difficile]|nr:hypothetical protein Q0Y04_15090 [Clostridioides difficile]
MGRRTTRVSRLGKEKKRSVLIVLAALVLIMGGFTYFLTVNFCTMGKSLKMYI